MKNFLESEYDIPFHVEKHGIDYSFYPEGSYKGELFEVKITHPTSIRVVIEAFPQAHAANMLRDYASATEEKQKLFLGYLDMFRQKGMKVSVLINGTDQDFHEWPRDWRGLYMRLTMAEAADIDKEESTKEWAVAAAGMMLSLLNIVPLGYEEGALTRVEVNKYERNRLNRELCLRLQGYACKICGMSFEKKYGEIGRNFIHVHHIEPVSMMGGSYVLDPEKDLIPVCPNCHAMLHTSNPPLSPETLKKMIQEK